MPGFPSQPLYTTDGLMWLQKWSPHEVLLGYCPSAAEELTSITNNETVEARHQLIKQHREAALHALNKVAQTTPKGQYHVGDWVWLKAKHLALPYASTKLAPKHHRPFKITKEISPVAYQLELPRAWTIHDIFHSLLLTPYKVSWCSWHTCQRTTEACARTQWWGQTDSLRVGWEKLAQGWRLVSLWRADWMVMRR